MTAVSRKKVVVFLPYQAAMWDSMESVWHSAHRDPDVEAIILPVPYARLEQGEVAEWCHEIEFFAHLPGVRDARTTTLAELRPDIVYTQNVYDHYNLVTRLDPRFHTAELRASGALVVYLPYFVTGGSLEEQHRELPGYRHVDIIVLQNEELAAQIHPASRAKVMVAGSPKVDRIVNTAQGFAERTDRAFRVLLNVGISQILRGGARAIQNVERDVERVLDQQNTVAVIRPHPLLEATLAAMRPQLTERWRALHLRCARESRIEWDTSKDVSRAIVTTDAYIGPDTSSLVHLAGAAGVPILLRRDSEMEPWSPEQRIPLYTGAAVIGQHLWMTLAGIDVMACADLESGETSIVAPLGERIARVRGHDALAQVGEMMVVAPNGAQEIVIVEPAERRVDSVPLPARVPRAFARVFEWRALSVLVPGNYPGIVFLDPSTGELDVWDDWLPLAAEAGLGSSDEAHPAPARAATLLGDNLWLAFANHGIVLCLDLSARKATRHEVGSGATAIHVEGDHFWITDSRRSVFVRYVLSTGQISEFANVPADFRGGAVPFLELVPYGGLLLAFPRDGSHILALDPDSGRVGTLPIGELVADVDGYSTRWPSVFSNVTKLDDGSIIAQRSSDGALLRLGVEGDVTWRRLHMVDSSVTDTGELASRFGPAGENLPWALVEDGMDVTVERFLRHVSSGTHDVDQQRAAYRQVLGPTNGSVGDMIHRAILRSARAGAAHR